MRFWPFKQDCVILTFKWSSFPVYTSGLRGLYDPNNWLTNWVIYNFFCLLFIYSLMLCFWRYKVVLYPYTTQFLNYTISLHMKYYFFMIHCIYALVLSLHFSVWRKYRVFFFSHFPLTSMWGHTDPEDQKCKHIFYIPSEQTNQAQFFFLSV